MPPRRAFLAGLLASGLLPPATWADAGNPNFLSAARRSDGSFGLYGLTQTGEITFSVPLPARGHAAAAHPSRAEAVAFARRPGTFAIVLDCATGQVNARLKAPRGRHFYGHGAFSADGDLLFTTENDFAAGRGVVGVWDAKHGFGRLTEFWSGGVGPHDIKRLPNGNLAVANGGIETHPETGRMKLNIATMRPNLSYLTPDGALVAQLELAPELHKASIRHLAIDPHGRVAMGLQWQGDISDPVPLVALDDRSTGRTRLAQGHAQRQMRGYVGSIAAAGNEIAITSPRGGLVQVLDASSLTVATEHARPDVCGLSANRSNFVLTTGGGTFEDLASGQSVRHLKLAWDNHTVRI